MIRFPDIPDAALDADQQRMAAVAQRSGPYRAFLRAPVLWERLQPLRRYFPEESVLCDRTREAVILALARHWESTGVFNGHRALAGRAGIDAETIAAIGHGEVVDLADPVAQAALECAVTLFTRHRLDDAQYAHARDILGERGIIELVALVGFFTTIALTLNIADISGDAPFDGSLFA